LPDLLVDRGRRRPLVSPAAPLSLGENAAAAGTLMLMHVLTAAIVVGVFTRR
jgi:hypothetical protein